MPGPDTPPSPEPALSRREKEQLLQKIYSLPHWIAIIRLFAYETLTMDNARGLIKPIAEEFGKEKTAEACEVLVEIVPGKEPAARLKAHIRRMAFQILGPEVLVIAAVPAPSKPLGEPKNQSATRKVPAKAERPIKQPRHFVLKRYQEWLNETGLAFVAVDDVSRTTPAVKPFIAGLDFIVLRGEDKLLVTVRPNLPTKNSNAAKEVQKLFGASYRSVRIWPNESAEGWKWDEHPIDSAHEDGDFAGKPA